MAREASSLLRVESGAILRREGWEEAFWTVGDEEHVRKAMSIVGRRGEKWSVLRVRGRVSGDLRKRVEDTEALARRGDVVYAFGSHFGPKEGPLDHRRQFVARFREPEAERGKRRVHVRMEGVRDAFRLHRAVNDALRGSDVPLLPRTDLERDLLVLAARARYARRQWANRIHPGDRALNVEGAAFLPRGTLLLGLRFPTSATGDPILVEIEDPDVLLTSRDALPRVRAVRPVAIDGAAPALRGVRALAVEDGELHMIAGSLDSKPGRSVVLRAHPDGGAVPSLHCRVRLGRGAAAAEPLTELSFDDAEGIAFAAGPERRPCFVRDVDARVRVLSP